MNQRVLSGIIIVVFWVLPVHGVAAEITLLGPTEGRQGGVVEIIAVSDLSTSLGDARLVSDAGNEISKNAFFPVGSTETRIIWACLLGISPTQSETAATLEVFSDQPGDIPVLLRSVRVISHHFAFETIDLDGKMSGLRQSRDPRRLKESRELWELLSAINRQSVFHLSEHVTPVSDARVTSYYGERRRFIYKDGGTDNSVHSGVDYAIARGTPVISSGAGRVAFAAKRIITGNTVVIEHLPGTYGLYYHLEYISVKQGDLIAMGAVIGGVGDTGLVTGVHLHWEIRVGGIPVDPDDMVNLQILDKAGIIKQISPE